MHTHMPKYMSTPAVKKGLQFQGVLEAERVFLVRGAAHKHGQHPPLLCGVVVAPRLMHCGEM